MTYQVIQDRHNEVLSGTHGAIVVSLKGAHGVVAVDCALAVLVQAGHHAEGVVREEPPAVQSVAQQLGHGLATHIPTMAVLISDTVGGGGGE